MNSEGDIADSCLPSEYPGREEDRSSQRTKKRGRDRCENHKPHPSCVRQQPDDEVKCKITTRGLHILYKTFSNYFIACICAFSTHTVQLIQIKQTYLHIINMGPISALHLFDMGNL